VFVSAKGAEDGIPCRHFPLNGCDFYFNGSLSTIPSFNIGPVSGNSILSHAKIFHRNGERLVTASSNHCDFFNDTESCGTTFFFMSEIDDWNKADVVGAHPIPSEVIQDFTGKCVILRVSNFYLSKSGWINDGDSRKGFPQSRRCLIFKTGNGTMLTEDLRRL
ncbi:unnamed protein product, partial [Closterium sp. NIES-53]